MATRAERTPLPVPAAAKLQLSAEQIEVKGPKGSLCLPTYRDVQIRLEEDQLHFSALNKELQTRAMTGTMRALLANMIKGVTDGFERRLMLNGVGYRAALAGNELTLTLGFSHPVHYRLPAGITAVVPGPTEIVLSGVDRQLLGQVAAEIRAFRPPEPYKGKGIRYAEEHVRRKETKKKK